jgi:hypothetical protein
VGLRLEIAAPRWRSSVRRSTESTARAVERQPKVPWLDEGDQGAVRTIDVSYSKAEETSGIVRHSHIGQVFVRLLTSGDLNITEKPSPGHETLIGEISARIGAVLRR